MESTYLSLLAEILALYGFDGAHEEKTGFDLPWNNWHRCCDCRISNRLHD